MSEDWTKAEIIAIYEEELKKCRKQLTMWSAWTKDIVKREAEYRRLLQNERDEKYTLEKELKRCTSKLIFVEDQRNILSDMLKVQTEKAAKNRIKAKEIREFYGQPKRKKFTK